MKKTYIFCGFTQEKKFGGKIGCKLKSDIKKSDSIVFIPGEYNISSKTEKYVKTDLEWFREIGIDFKKSYILENSNYSIDEMKRILCNADVIFLMSGFAVQQDKFLKENRLKDIIKNSNGVVIGVSAGAINLGKVSVCSIDKKNKIEKTYIYKGIGRINYTFEPHFSCDSLNLPSDLSMLSKKLKIYGISNDIALRIVDDSYEIIDGNIYTIKNSQIAKIEEEDRCY